MTLEIMWNTLGWFWLVWWGSAGLMVLALQFLLPRAFESVRASPPRGPGWAHGLWYGRERIYGRAMALSLLLGALAAASYLLLTL